MGVVSGLQRDIDHESARATDVEEPGRRDGRLDDPAPIAKCRHLEIAGPGVLFVGATGVLGLGESVHLTGVGKRVQEEEAATLALPVLGAVLPVARAGWRLRSRAGRW